MTTKEAAGGMERTLFAGLLEGPDVAGVAAGTVPDVAEGAAGRGAGAVELDALAAAPRAVAARAAHRVVIGLDPGSGGGIACLDWDGRVVYAVRMPETEWEILQQLRSGLEPGVTVAHAWLEKVHSSPQMGVVSAFTFGMNYGKLRMALLACGIPLDEVTPGKWQKFMQCLTKGDKNVSKARAQELFAGQAKVTHATADALLLAEYGRRKWQQIS